MSQICNIEREPSRVHLLDFPNGKVTLLGIGKKYMNIFDCFKIRYPQFETILYISICSLKVAIHWQLGLLYFQTHTHMAMAQNWDSYPHLQNIYSMVFSQLGTHGPTLGCTIFGKPVRRGFVSSKYGMYGICCIIQ